MGKNRRNRHPQRRGFTLVEMMIVLFIVVSVLALAVMNLQTPRLQAQRRTTFATIKIYDDAVNMFILDCGTPPESLRALVDNPGYDSWAGPYLKSSAPSTDAWNREFQYAVPGNDGREFDIWSVGPDGQSGTDDDIGSWMNRI